MIDQLLQYFKKDAPESAPEGLCPNCWGRQEYSGKFYDAVKQNQIDLKNVGEKKGWIQAYAAEHFEGIQLKASKAGEGTVCEKCKVVYKT